MSIGGGVFNDSKNGPGYLFLLFINVAFNPLCRVHNAAIIHTREKTHQSLLWFAGSLRRSCKDEVK